MINNNDNDDDDAIIKRKLFSIGAFSHSAELMNLTLRPIRRSGQNYIRGHGHGHDDDDDHDHSIDRDGQRERERWTERANKDRRRNARTGNLLPLVN